MLRRAATVGALVLGVLGARLGSQSPAIRPADKATLRAYAGVYQWDRNAFLYLQMWEEDSGFGKPTLVAFDESGELRMPVAESAR